MGTGAHGRAELSGGEEEKRMREKVCVCVCGGGVEMSSGGQSCEGDDGLSGSAPANVRGQPWLCLNHTRAVDARRSGVERIDG